MGSHQYFNLTLTNQMFLALLLLQIQFLKFTSSGLGGNPLSEKLRAHLKIPTKLFEQFIDASFQHDELLEPLIFPSWERSYAGYTTPWKSEAAHADIGSKVMLNEMHFKVDLDVQHFKPEEISVKLMDDNTLSIEGKHEKRQDEYGYISRHFVRRYFLPRNIDIHRIKSTFFSDGVLIISAPVIETKVRREIPIEKTEELARRTERTEEQGEEHSKKSETDTKEV